MKFSTVKILLTIFLAGCYSDTDNSVVSRAPIVVHPFDLYLNVGGDSVSVQNQEVVLTYSKISTGVTATISNFDTSFYVDTMIVQQNGKSIKCKVSENGVFDFQFSNNLLEGLNQITFIPISKSGTFSPSTLSITLFVAMV